MTRCAMLRLGLSIPSLLILAFIADAQTLQQSVAITMDPGQSTVESFQLTVPIIAETTTQISMVTVTQVSMQTVTVPGTCAATPQSTMDVVTAGALNQLNTTASAASTVPSLSATSGASVLQAAPAASSGQCDCSCLCPAAAFQGAAFSMAANTSQAAPISSVQLSTFQTMASASVANKVAVPSSSGSISEDSMAMMSSSMNPVSTSVATTSTSQSGVLPSVIVTDPAPPTSQAQIQNAQDAAFNINTYQLMQSVGLPVVVGG